MSTQTDPPIQAIPTVYNGVQLRSRMEAQCALLFDAMKWVWEYEPESIMLPCGVCYTPDFWLPAFDCVVECRGYKSPKGNKQIEGFRDLLSVGAATHAAKLATSCHYLTIGPDRCEMFSGYDNSLCPGSVAWCPDCEIWVPSSALDPHCTACGAACLIDFLILLDHGKLIVGNLDSEKFSSLDHDLGKRMTIWGAARKLSEISRVMTRLSER